MINDQTSDGYISKRFYEQNFEYRKLYEYLLYYTVLNYFKN